MPSAELPQGGGAPLLEVRNLVQEFAIRGRGDIGKAVVHAVSDVSFAMHPQETFAIVGETGCGKSTVARSIIQAPHPKSGEVLLNGVDLTKLKGRSLRDRRRAVQMVFQDPFTSLDPNFTVERSVAEPLVGQGLTSRSERHQRVAEMLQLVGLDPAIYRRRHPRQLSGGQNQRVAIARALSVSPELIICDEPLSSLDVLIQSQILKLFARLQQQLGLSYLFISHALPVVKQISDRVGVMYLGKLCELAPTSLLFGEAAHPYTVALLAANPTMNPAHRAERTPIPVAGEPPSPIDPPSGCRFRTRCPFAEERCALEEPVLQEVGSGHYVACHYPYVASQILSSQLAR